MASSLTIGQLARAAGVNVETIRYYQRVGLIAEPPKPLDGYRRYPAEAVDRLRFIRRAQRLGFRLKEIGELLELGDGRCADVRDRAEAKRAQIDRQIQDLRAMRATLDGLIEACRSGQVAPGCPIVASLAGRGGSQGR